jgi:hypothetical protein
MPKKQTRKSQAERPEPEAEEIPPQEFDARHYQQDALDARHGRTVAPSGGLDKYGRFVGCNGWDKARGPCDRFLLNWHRRAGKDRFGLELIREECERRVGSYWHLYPLQVQAKKAIWNAVDTATGTRLLDLVFPEAMRDGKPNDQELFMRFKNGSTYQLCGSDAYDRLVGANPVGLLKSEWALCDPRSWGYLSPILLENGGWAAFITTYRGRNHAYQMAQKLRTNPLWYVDVRTIDMTRRANGEPVVAPADVRAERESLVTMHGAVRADALIQEEFYCNPMASAPGSVYGASVAKMLAEGRA